MKPAGRVGDIAFCPSDSHGCPACPHPVQGPAIQGSPNVLINDLPALRVNDQGMHSSCCGKNQWFAASGANGVLINNRFAHREGDATKHCGGTGKLVKGSTDVSIGDFSGCRDAKREGYDQGFIVYWQYTGVPAKDVKYRLTCNDGRVFEGTTGPDGETNVVGSEVEGLLSVEIFDGD